MSLVDLIEELEAAKDPEKAGPMEAYMRHQFPFQVLQVLKETPSIKVFSSAEKTKMIDWDFVDTCWEKEPREYQYVAANYLKAMQSYLTKDNLPKLERLVVTKSWWEYGRYPRSVVGSLVYASQNLKKGNSPMESIR